MGMSGRAFFDYRLERLEHSLAEVAKEVSSLNSQGVGGWRRLEQIEADLRTNEREVLRLKSQGEAHDSRLISIEATLKDLHSEIKLQHEHMQSTLDRNHHEFVEHVTEETQRSNKILMSVLVSIAAIVLSFILDFILRGLR
jgi:chromosome segregation ATPase